MRVVINNAPGGFGISNEALIRLIERGAAIVIEVPCSCPLDPESVRLVRLSAIAVGPGETAYPVLAKLYPLRDGFIGYHGCEGVVGKDGAVYGLASGDAVRADADLVAVVREMGKDANDEHSALLVIEIPDNIDWYIEDQQGIEEVHEEHRTWPWFDGAGGIHWVSQDLEVVTK